MDRHPGGGTFVVNATHEPIQEVGLPPSKSHLIRWLLMAAQSDGVTRIANVNGAAFDACSMRDALIQLGVRIDVETHTWTVHGVGVDGFSVPTETLDLHNSGTAFRLLSFACLRKGEAISITGDSTLDSRIDRHFWESLGVAVEFPSEQQSLPLRIQGPFSQDQLSIDGSKTSQHISAILLSMPSRKKALDLTIEGDIVSLRHAQLSFEIAARCGSENMLGDWHFQPWKCKAPSNVDIPFDASHIAFWKLYERLHSTRLQMPFVSPNDSIGAELLQGIDLNKEQVIDLSQANDLITPLAAAMALGGGGTITGASHARHKETNRIEQTAAMLASFSMNVECTMDGLSIQSGQLPKSPASTVPTFGDHRMQMTAAVLATKVGAEIEGRELHQVSFPDFLGFLQP